MPRTTTSTTFKVSATRTFGIEIEAYGASMTTVAAELTAAGIPCVIEGYNHETRSHWKLVCDGSIQGPQSFELVSPVLCGQDGIRQIHTVCEVLARLNVQVNRSCGLHVHHGANDLTLKDWQNLACLWLKHEATLDTLVPASRRAGANSFCKSLRTQLLARCGDMKTVFKAIKATTSLRDLNALVCGQDRYYTLNLTAFWRHGTVEVRMHSGTIDAAKISHWVSLTQCLIVRAIERQTVSLKGTDLAGLTYKGWVKTIDSKPSKQTIMYYEARQIALAR